MSLAGNERILYAVVAHGDIILAVYSERPGNFEAVAKQLLSKIDRSKNDMQSLVYTKEHFVFHYLVDNGLIYLCMADEGFSRLVSFRFLEDIKNRFIGNFGVEHAKMAQSYAYNADFRETIRKGLISANDPRNMQYRSSDAKITQINDEIEKTKNTVMLSIEKVLDRGDKLELLLDKADHLADQGRVFKGSANKLKRRMVCKNVKMTLLLIFIVLAVIYVIFAMICGWDGSTCFKK